MASRGHEYKKAKEHKTRKDLHNAFNYDYCNGDEMVQRKEVKIDVLFIETFKATN